MKMKYFLKVPLFLGVMILFFSCTKDILDRLKGPKPIGSIRVDTEHQYREYDKVSGIKPVKKYSDHYYVYKAKLSSSYCETQKCEQYAEISLDNDSEHEGFQYDISWSFMIDEPLKAGSRITLQKVRWGNTMSFGGKDSYGGASYYGGEVMVKSVSSKEVTLSFRDVKFRHSPPLLNHRYDFFDIYVIINGDITLSREN